MNLIRKLSSARRCLSLAYCMLMVSILIGQSVAINSTNLPADSSSILDVSSLSQGILIPRITEVARLSIIDPPDGLWVYQTDGLAGMYIRHFNKWTNLTNRTSDNIPIGGVMDWYPLGQSLPPGFMICDGSTVTDTESPFFNEVLPNLDEQFIKGVALPDMDAIGGTSSHIHTVDLGGQNTNETPSHTHYTTPLNGTTGSSGEHGSHGASFSITSSNEGHTHEWATITANENWYSSDINGDSKLMINWTSDGVGAEGEGHYPIGIYSPGGTVTQIFYFTNNHFHSHTASGSLYANPAGAHTHNYTIPQTTSTNGGSHHHITQLESHETSTGTNIPQYIRLLKIMRIK